MDSSRVIVIAIALGFMAAAPIVAWRMNSHFSQVRHARLKWASVIAYGEVLGVALLSLDAGVSSTGPITDDLEKLSIGCMLLAFCLFLGPINFLLIDVRSYREARKLARQAARQ
jgi:hypothetical protein